MIENYLKRYFTKSDFMFFFGIFLFGVLLNIFRCTNVLFNSDNLLITSSGVGSTYESGRWFLGIIGDILRKIGMDYNISTFNTYVSIFLLCCTILIIIKLFKIKNNYTKLIIALLFVSYPVVNSTLYYMFTAPVYFFAVLLSTLSVFSFFELRHIKKFLISIILFVLSIGIYQGYIPYTITLFLIKLFIVIYEQDNNSFSLKIFVLLSLQICIVLLCSICLYALINNIILNIKHIQLISYQGINTMFDLSIKGLLLGMKNSYIEFFKLIFTGTKSINEQILSKLSTLIMLLMFFVFIIKDMMIMNNQKRISLITMLLLFPMSVNFIYVMSNNMNIYLLMKLGTIGLWILLLVYLDLKSSLYLAYKRLIIILCIPILFYNCYFAFYNQQATYHANETAKHFYTLLASRIIALDNYNTNMPIMIYGEFDDNLSYNNYVVDANASSRLYEGVPENDLNIYSRNYIFANYVGINNDVINIDDNIVKTKQFKDMPIFPNKKSIQIINDIIVVKASR